MEKLLHRWIMFILVLSNGVMRISPECPDSGKKRRLYNLISLCRLIKNRQYPRFCSPSQKRIFCNILWAAAWCSLSLPSPPQQLRGPLGKHTSLQCQEQLILLHAQNGTLLPSISPSIHSLFLIACPFFLFWHAEHYGPYSKPKNADD